MCFLFSNTNIASLSVHVPKHSFASDFLWKYWADVDLACNVWSQDSGEVFYHPRLSILVSVLRFPVTPGHGSARALQQEEFSYAELALGRSWFGFHLKVVTVCATDICQRHSLPWKGLQKWSRDTDSSLHLFTWPLQKMYSFSWISQDSWQWISISSTV